MERQGLVVSSKKGIAFCKEWDTKQMCLFFQQNLPRPFQYFTEAEGFDQQKLSNSESSLPYRLLRKVRQNYSVISVPEKHSDLTGKFYHEHATGPKGSGYKNRFIILSTSKSPLLSLFVSTNLHTSQFQRNPFPKMSSMSGNATQFRRQMRWRGRRTPMTKGWMSTSQTRNQRSRCMLVPAGHGKDQGRVRMMARSHTNASWPPKKLKLNPEAIWLPRNTLGTGREHIVPLYLMVLSPLFPSTLTQLYYLQMMTTFQLNQSGGQRGKKGHARSEGDHLQMVSPLLSLAFTCTCSFCVPILSRARTDCHL